MCHNQGWMHMTEFCPKRLGKINLIIITRQLEMELLSLEAANTYTCILMHLSISIHEHKATHAHSCLQ